MTHKVRIKKNAVNARDFKQEQAELIRLFNSGDYISAERLARKATRRYPKRAFAWKALGAILQKLERPQEAINAKKVAVECDPDDLEASFNLANSLRMQGNLLAAESLYRKIIERDSSYVKTYVNLAATLRQSRRLPEAAATLREAVRLAPTSAVNQSNLGCVLRELNELPEALTCLCEAVRLDPTYIEACSNLAGVLIDLGQIKEAEDFLRGAIAKNPNDARSWLNYADLFCRTNRPTTAEVFYQEALRLNSNLPGAYVGLGIAQKKMSNLAAAEKTYREGIRRFPSMAELHNNLGTVQKKAGKYHEAETSFRLALQICPNYHDAEINLSSLLNETGRNSEAIETLQNTVRVTPESLAALTNLGAFYRQDGKPVLAEKCLRTAIAGDQNFAPAYVNLGIALSDQGKFEESDSTYRRAIAVSSTYESNKNDLLGFRVPPIVSNMLMNMTYSPSFSPEQIKNEAESYGRSISANAEPKYTSWHRFRNGEPLRVGFVSGDLKNHPVAFFLEGTLRNIDHRRLKVFAFSNTHILDEVSTRLKPLFDYWLSISDLSDRDAAELIRQQRIDVLIDLSGHTSKNRLPIFSYKPSLVQMTWMGYWATTGIPEIEYFITDKYSTPTEYQSQFTEQLVFLPSTRLCFTPPELDIPVGELPAISSGHVTFGCFNNLIKVSDTVIDLWSSILTQLPNSRIFLKSKQLGEPPTVERILTRFGNNGVQKTRIILEAHSSREHYLKCYNRVDITLDTFPFSGGTTTAESLWMGVPVLTLRGKSCVARQGVSLLSNVGLTEWIAEDVKEYKVKASEFSRQIDSLALLRKGLRSDCTKSPAFSSEKFAHQFEDLLFSVYENHVNNIRS